MTFGAPFFLIGFAALAVPIIIHLWSKNTRSSLSFGSLRFLKETETRTMRSIMPSQWLLLFLRLLLLSILVLILAEPLLRSPNSLSVSTRYLVDPAYAEHPLIAQLRDTISNNDELLWLSDGFPDLSDDVPVNSVSYWSLLSQQLVSGANETVVISPLKASNFWGAKRSFPLEYRWIQLPTNPIREKGIQFVSRGASYQLNSTFTHEKTSHEWTTIEKTDPIVILYALEVSDGFEDYEVITRAAISTLNELSPVSFKESSIEEAEWLFWFSNEPAPRVENIVVIDPGQVTPWLNLTSDRVSLSSDWTRELAVQEQFAKRLLTLVAGNVERETSDALSFHPSVFEYDLSEGKLQASILKDVSHWLWILLILVLLFERFVAFKSDQK